MLHTDNFVDKKFSILLEDAVFFLEEALGSQPDDGDVNYEKYNQRLREASFTRASLLNSALLLESAANCCIRTLEISKALFGDIDKLKAKHLREQQENNQENSNI